ncbi:MAG: DUF1934 domain-containing protein [Candidatus Faecousia sp.]|nr:DUF1934 domain-containing protein [Bacillota bacterium]MDY4754817.1 DUF1934 domain-containing protein [Candidatus Faecousia sp.]MDY6159180.1 DUF1934 domain-containing protein [Candidatus Faecousia sp.]
MSIPVILSIQGRQTYVGQEPELIRLDTEGTMEFRNGGWDITYEESELTGLAGVTTTFRVEPDKVTLTRTGKLTSTMVFQEGVPHDSLYRMEFGALMISVNATRLFFDIVPDGGSIDLVYNIIIENTEAGVIDYHLDIRAK